jgi:hypothetical protein
VLVAVTWCLALGLLWLVVCMHDGMLLQLGDARKRITFQEAPKNSGKHWQIRTPDIAAAFLLPESLSIEGAKENP